MTGINVVLYLGSFVLALVSSYHVGRTREKLRVLRHLRKMLDTHDEPDTREDVWRSAGRLQAVNDVLDVLL